MSGVVDFEPIDAEELSKLAYTELILGTLTRRTNSSQATSPRCTVIDGNFAKVKVLSYGYNLGIQWVTYRLGGLPSVRTSVQLHNHRRRTEGEAWIQRGPLGVVHGHEHERAGAQGAAPDEAERPGQTRVVFHLRRISPRLRPQRLGAGRRPARRPTGQPTGVVLVPPRRRLGSRSRRGLHRGPSVAFEVEAPPPPKKKFPWWILAVVGAVVLLIIIGVVVFLLVRDDDSKPATVPAVVGQPTAVGAKHAHRRGLRGHPRATSALQFRNKTGSCRAKIQPPERLESQERPSRSSWVATSSFRTSSVAHNSSLRPITGAGLKSRVLRVGVPVAGENGIVLAQFPPGQARLPLGGLVTIRVGVFRRIG